ncbi:magnesium transporter [Pseudonocardia acidicola]|uniref:Magnesium transporter n=1 Tax=Pseudonocardia acidicola TaxID=2724939 RepID=A0ABX1SMU9_9PSEU|nr:magnesium transporter [Pseudonocardia acidicola]
MRSHPSVLTASAVRGDSRPRSGRATTNRAVRSAIISLVGLLGSVVRNQTGQEVGRLADVVVRLDGEEQYPPVTGLVVRVGRRRVFVGAADIAAIGRDGVTLRTARLDLRDFVRRPGEVLLARDVLDHQLVDVDGVQVIRAADLYLAPVGDRIRLVGVDVGVRSLLRRLGPKRLRGRPTPERVIDWDAVAPLGGESADAPSTVRLRRSQEALHRLRPGELADLLEDLGRPGRQQLLASLEPEQAADALEEMDPDELEGLLRESSPDRAAELIGAMEPDEAVDALRDLSPQERDELLKRMPAPTRERLRGLLRYPEKQAGGFMTTVLVTAGEDDTVGAVRARLGGLAEHRNEIDAVVVCDAQHRVVADVGLFDLLVTPAEERLGELVHAGTHTDPVVVEPEADAGRVAAALVEARRSSLLVVDPDCHPLGRILADDVIDALISGDDRMHFPRLLQ